MLAIKQFYWIVPIFILTKLILNGVLLNSSLPTLQKDTFPWCCGPYGKNNTNLSANEFDKQCMHATEHLTTNLEFVQIIEDWSTVSFIVSLIISILFIIGWFFNWCCVDIKQISTKKHILAPNRFAVWYNFFMLTLFIGELSYVSSMAGYSSFVLNKAVKEIKLFCLFAEPSGNVWTDWDATEALLYVIVGLSAAICLLDLTKKQMEMNYYIKTKFVKKYVGSTIDTKLEYSDDEDLCFKTRITSKSEPGTRKFKSKRRKRLDLQDQLTDESDSGWLGRQLGAKSE